MKFDRLLYAMIFIRIISSLIEMSAAYLMYHFKSLETAIRINAVLGMVGPFILTLVTFIGLVGISSQITPRSLVMIALGVGLILLGTR